MIVIIEQTSHEKFLVFNWKQKGYKMLYFSLVCKLKWNSGQAYKAKSNFYKAHFPYVIFIMGPQ